MSFTSKNLQTTRRSGLSVLKGATLFFLGMSAVMFMTRGYLQITTDARNTNLQIEKIRMSQGGNPTSSTGIFLDGSGGNAYFAGKVGIGVLPSNSRALNVNSIALGDDSEAIYRSGENIIMFNGYPDAKVHMTRSLSVQDDVDIISGDLDIGNLTIGASYIKNILQNIVFDTIPDSTKSTLVMTTGGYVGIGTITPSAHLDVHGDVKVLGSIEGKGGFTGSATSGYVRYYPSGSSGYTSSTGLNTDSIWYITCTAPATATGFMIYGMTGNYLATGSAYFSMFQRGQFDTFTYHLRAGETFAIDTKNMCDRIIVSKQEYGKPNITYGGGNLINPISVDLLVAEGELGG